MIHSLEVLNTSGHLTITWDPSDQVETADARKAIEGLKAQGYTFFVVDGATGEALGAVRLIKDPTEPVQPGDITPEPAPLDNVVHLGAAPVTVTATDLKCQGTTAKGKRCSRNARKGESYCGHHLKKGKSSRLSKAPGKGRASTSAPSGTPPTPGRKMVAVRRMAGG